jgi:hypothetical protein
MTQTTKTSNDIQLLNKGDYATFKNEYGDIVKRKVQQVWKHLNGTYRYNTSGNKGGQGCNGFQFMNEDIIKIN